MVATFVIQDKYRTVRSDRNGELNRRGLQHMSAFHIVMVAILPLDSMLCSSSSIVTTGIGATDPNFQIDVGGGWIVEGQTVDRGRELLV
jgi:hypothetical protein